MGSYYEKHHIIPKCWGGGNSKNNIVYLTAREHYIAHWLLYRIRPTSNGVALAFWKMTFPGGKHLENRNYKISSRMYEEAKLANLSPEMAEKLNNLNKSISAIKDINNTTSYDWGWKKETIQNELENIKKVSMEIGAANALKSKKDDDNTITYF